MITKDALYGYAVGLVIVLMLVFAFLPEIAMRMGGAP